MGLFRPDVLGAFDRATLRAILKAALADAGHNSVAALRLRGQPTQWRGHPNPFRRIASPTASPAVAYQRELAGDADALCEEVLSRRQRKLVRQKEKKLRQLGTVVAQRADTPRARLACLEAFLGQKSIQLSDRNCANVFAERSVQRFLRELAITPPSRETTTEFFSLKLDNRSVATLLGQRHGDVFHALAISMTSDAAVVPHSPGLLLMHHVVRHACATGATTFDFGPGGGQHKSTWRADPVAMFETHHAMRVPGHPSALAFAAISATKSAVKSNRLLARAARTTAALSRRVMTPSRLHGRRDRAEQV